MPVAVSGGHSVAMYGPLIAEPLPIVELRVQVQGLSSLWLKDLAAIQHVGAYQSWDLTLVSCIGRWIPKYWTTQEALYTLT